MSSITPAKSVAFVLVLGCRSSGDGGGGTYQRVNIEPAHPGKIRSNDGAWWELVADVAKPEYFGSAGVHKDATSSIRDAISYAVVRGCPVQFGIGIYEISAAIDLPRGLVIRGVVPRLYPNFDTDWQKLSPSWAEQATSIQFGVGLHGSIFTGGDNCDIEGIVFRCGGSRSNDDRLFSALMPPSHLRLARCVFQNLYCIADSQPDQPFGAWIFSENVVIGCHLGVGGCLVDCRFDKNTFTAVAFAALDLGTRSGFNVILGNRFEWGDGPAIRAEGCVSPNQFTSNVFDAHRDAAVSLVECAGCQSFVSNLFWRNGRGRSDAPNRSCHISVVGDGRHVFAENTFLVGDIDGVREGTTVGFPRHVVAFENCQFSSMFFSGSTRQGCASTKVFFDIGGRSRSALNCRVIELTAAVGADEDPIEFLEALKIIENIASGVIRVVIFNSRRAKGGSLRADHIML